MMLSRLSPLPLGSQLPASARQLSPVSFGRGQDSFSSGKVDAQTLFHHFKINPADVSVIAEGCEISPKDKEALLAMYLRAYYVAVKAAAVLGTSQPHGAAVKLENGVEGYASNRMPSLQREVLCAECAALSAAYNTHIPNLIEAVNEGKANADKDFTKTQTNKIDWIVIANDRFGDTVTSCTTCRSWMECSQYYRPNTIVATVGTDPNTGKYVLFARTVEKLLPFVQKQQPSLTKLPIQALNLAPSPEGASVIQQYKIPQKTLYRMMAKAKKAFTQNKNAPYSGQNVAVAVLLSSGQIVSGAQIDWKMQRSPHPDTRVAGMGLERVQQYRERLNRVTQALLSPFSPQRREAIEGFFTSLRTTLETQLPLPLYWILQRVFPKEPIILGIAYYGEVGRDVPPVYSLELFAKKMWGGPEKAILVIEDEKTLRVRTIDNYLKARYKDSLETLEKQKTKS